MHVTKRLAWATTIALVAILGVGNSVFAGVTFTEYSVPTPGSSPGGIAAGPDGNLWLTESAANKVARVTPTGSISEYTIPYLGFDAHNGLNDDPAGVKPIGIVTGPDGNLWFAENNGHAVGRVTPSGSFTQYATTGYSGFITAGPDGNLWLTEGSSDKVARVTTGGTVTEYPLPDPYPSPTERYPGPIAVGSDHNLWFTEPGCRACGGVVHKVAKMDTSGTLLAEYDVGGVGSFPFGITAGPDGNLWVVEFGGNNVARVTTSGVVTEFPITTASSVPIMITAGPDGKLWFTENAANQVAEVSTSGVFTEYPVPTPTSGPVGITTGPDANIWFTELSGNKVARITPSAPTTADQCKDGGWQIYGIFKNQGDCVSYVVTGTHNPPG
jgi:streptogramin lyase